MTPAAEVCAIGVDAGTTNVKVVLVDEEGTLLASAQRPVATFQDGDVGEQDAAELWSAVEAAITEVSGTAPEAAARVEAVSCTSQYSSVVAVDSNGDPVAPMILWTDKRGGDHCWTILGEHESAFDTWIDRHGVPPVGGGFTLSHLLHLQHDRPDVHERTDVWLEPMDFINLRLTGRAAASQDTMLMSQLCDNRTLGVTEYDAEMVAMSGIDADRLPLLLAPADPVGALLPEVAERLGLPVTATVYGGSRDTSGGVVGTGALADGRGGLSIGTTSFMMDTITEKAVDIDHELLGVPSSFPDTYLTLAETGIGGRALEHVLGQMFHALDELADHRTADEFAQLDDVLSSVPPGSRGVIFLPWLNGTQSPDSDEHARAAFLNLSLATGRAEMIRAVVEGLAHNVGWLLPHLEAFTGRAMDEIAFLGGAARSSGWCQILADVLDRPILSMDQPEQAVARGAAGLALWHHGTIDRGRLHDWVPAAARFEPDPAHRAMYDTMHAQFEAAFTALRPIHEALNS